MTEKVKAGLVLLAFCIFMALVLFYSTRYTDSLGRVADCVTTTATAQGYAGNPHGREAWDLFAPLCR